ncbi:MAG: hypothetical protein J3Q66DRAFT_331954 [Benniella sp.]|nr:MAG: hypothetical protein J3Q66DRAFT_331954 [Benniella sp.]
MRSLSIHEHNSTHQLEFAEHCTMLKSLLIRGPPRDDEFDATYWDKCKALVRQNSAHLRSLTMILWNKSCDGRQMPPWTPISECMELKNLRSLSVKGGSINRERRALYWRVFENLESLALESIYVAPPPSDTDDPKSQSNPPVTRFPKLRKLALNCLNGTDLVSQLDWIICVCPMLQTLKWTLRQTTRFPVQFKHHFVGLTWPELDSITIKGHLDDVTHEDYKSILEAAPRPFKALDLQIQYLKPDLITLLRESHFKTLTKMDLSMAVGALNPKCYVMGIPSLVQEVLQSCPLLEHITAKTITTTVIINGEPWVCLRLKEFKVMIDTEFWKTEPERQSRCHAVFEQLGQLRQLRVFDFRRHDLFPRTRPYFPLPLELRFGLGRLSRLEDIEVIGFNGPQDIRMADLEWVLRSWPQLVAMYGEQLSFKRSRTFKGGYVRNLLLASMLKSRGVRFLRHENDQERRASLDVGAVYDTDSENESEVKG